MRLAKRQHASLDGVGAFLYGGRWNSKGKHVVYAASCAALAVLEYRAHVALPSGLMLMRIEIPDTLKIERVRAVPADPAAFLQIGDSWIDAQDAAVLEVPSVLVPEQKNYLINPRHPLFPAIQVLDVNPFAMDSRLLSSSI